MNTMNTNGPFLRLFFAHFPSYLRCWEQPCRKGMKQLVFWHVFQFLSVDFQEISDAMLRTALVMKSGDKVQLGWQGGAAVGAVLGLECLDLD